MSPELSQRLARLKSFEYSPIYTNLIFLMIYTFYNLSRVPKHARVPIFRSKFFTRTSRGRLGHEKVRQQVVIEHLRLRNNIIKIQLEVLIKEFSPGLTTGLLITVQTFQSLLKRSFDSDVANLECLTSEHGQTRRHGKEEVI